MKGGKKILKKFKNSYWRLKKNGFWIAHDLEHKTITICKGRKVISLDSLETKILKEAIKNQSTDDMKQIDFLL